MTERLPWNVVVKEWLALGVLYREERMRIMAGHICLYCEGPAETLDHALPRARGGTDDWFNLMPVCQRCNFQKRAMTLDEWHRSLDRAGDSRAGNVRLVIDRLMLEEARRIFAT